MSRYMWWALPALVAAVPAQAQVLTHPAQVQVKENIDSVLKTVRDASLGEAQKLAQIERYADRYLDYERISALAVGAPWRQFTPAQKSAFIEAFKDLMIRMYARSAMMGAAKSQVTVLPKISENGAGRTDVFTELRTGSGKKYEVAYQLYLSGGVYKVYNIRVDGVSLVTVYRNQFNELIRTKGIDGTIAHLRSRGLKPVKQGG